MSLESSWSGTGWQDGYWSFHPVNMTLVKPDAIAVLEVICLFTRGGRPVPFRPTSVTSLEDCPPQTTV